MNLDSLHKLPILTLAVLLAVILTPGCSRAETTLRPVMLSDSSVQQTEPTEAPFSLPAIKKPRLLPKLEPQDHSGNNKMKVVLPGSLVHVHSLHPLRMEALYSQPITLREALQQALTHNLPIKISGESWKFQRYEYYATLGLMLPTNSLTWSLLHSRVSPTDTLSDARFFSQTMSFPIFQGGGIVYSALAQYYRSKGWHEAHKATINDTLLSVYNRYSNLVLQRALLQIRSKSRDLSEQQHQVNKRMYEAGSGTRLAVMQYKAQLESDTQALLEQQVACRQAALDLAFDLDFPMGINLVPAEDMIAEADLVDLNEPFNLLLNKALARRPELRQYELFRLAAARTVQASASSFYPQVILFAQYNHISTTVAGPLSGLAGIANQNIAATQSSGILPPVSVNALGQQANFSPTDSSTANSGANTGAATTVAGSGGSPTAAIQSGGLVTSGGVAPTLVNASGTGFVQSTGTTVGGGVFPGLFNTFQIGFQLNWLVPYANVSTAAAVTASRALARQAMNQSNQELILVSQQVHADRLKAVTARKRIDVAAAEVGAAREALRMAEIKLEVGAETNLELLKAQRKYVDARINQVRAIVDSCQAQAQLLHDIGIISADALAPGSNEKPGS